MPGIVDPHNDEKGVAIMNTGEECITFYPGAAVATCNSSYETQETNHETEITGIDNPQEPKVIVRAEKPCSVPSHLKDLFEKSSALLNREEKGRFAELLIKYGSVFSRSSDHLGQTDRVLNIDFQKCREKIAGFLNEFCNRWCKREHVECDALKDWKLNIFKIKDRRISFYS